MLSNGAEHLLSVALALIREATAGPTQVRNEGAHHVVSASGLSLVDLFGKPLDDCPISLIQDRGCHIQASLFAHYQVHNRSLLKLLEVAQGHMFSQIEFVGVRKDHRLRALHVAIVLILAREI